MLRVVLTPHLKYTGINKLTMVTPLWHAKVIMVSMVNMASMVMKYTKCTDGKDHYQNALFNRIFLNLTFSV